MAARGSMPSVTRDGVGKPFASTANLYAAKGGNYGDQHDVL